MFDIPIPLPAEPFIVHEIIAESGNEFQWNTPLSEIAQVHLATMSEEQMDNNWGLNDFFGTIAVINLPAANLRRETITKELEGIACNFEIFQGVDGRKEVSPEIWNKFYGTRSRDLDPNTSEDKIALDKINQGRAGAYLSHYLLIKKIKECFDRAMQDYKSAQNSQDLEAIKHAKKELKKYSRVLILEDDAAFGVVDEEKVKVTKKTIGKRLRLAITELPDDWNMLYFIVRAKEEPEEISPHLCKIKSSYCQAGYAVNYTMYEPIISLLSQVEDPLVEKTRSVDIVLGLIHHQYHVYALKKSLIYHQPGPSQIADNTHTEIFQPNPWPN